MIRPRQLRAVTIGYQGMGNVGDEAILRGIEIALGDRIQIAAIAAGPHAVAAASGARRLAMPHHLPSLELLAALRRADILIVAGGGLLNDYWATLIPRYLLLTGVARLLGCRVAWLGVGAGPIRRRPWRWLAGRTIELSNLFGVRDAPSLALVRDLTSGSNISHVPDPAWFSTPALESTRPSTDGLAVVVRPPIQESGPAASNLYDALSDIVARRAVANQRTTLLSMEFRADQEALREVRDRLAGRGLQVTVEALPIQPPAAVERLGRFEAVVSMRLHGLVLSALANRPCLPVIYDQKVAAAAEQLGLDDLALPLEEVSANTIEERLRLVRSEDRMLAVCARVEQILATRHALVAALESIA